MEQSVYAPGGPLRLDDDDISAVKSEFGLHSYDKQPDDIPLSWMSEDEIMTIAKPDTLFCFDYKGKPYAAFFNSDCIKMFHIGFTYEDLKQEDDHIKKSSELSRNSAFSCKELNKKSFLEGRIEEVANLHKPNGREKRLFLETGKIWIRGLIIDRRLSTTHVMKTVVNQRWLKHVAKCYDVSQKKEAITMMFIVGELRKISTSPSVLEITNFESLLDTENTMSSISNNRKQKDMKVVGKIDLNTVPTGTKPVTIEELNALIDNLNSERTSLEDRISNIRTKQAELETKFPMPRDPYTAIAHNEIKKPLSKRVKALVHDYDFADENHLAFRRGTYEGVLCLRNFDGQLGFWYAFNYDGDGKTVEFEEGKVGDIVENMVLRYANTAELYLCSALHEQTKHKIKAYKDGIVAKYSEACEAVGAEREKHYDEYEKTIRELVDGLYGIKKQIEDTEERIEVVKEEQERIKALQKAKHTKANVKAKESVTVADNGNETIVQADEAVRNYAESTYTTNEDVDFPDTFDQMYIESAAANGESYDIVIRSLQDLGFIHHLRGRRFVYGEGFPVIAKSDQYVSINDEFLPYIGVAELIKLIGTARSNSTHTCYVTNAYLSKMAEHINSMMDKTKSILDLIPDGSRFTGSFICPVDKQGGHHIYIFDIRRDVTLACYRIAHMYDNELIGTCNYNYRGNFNKPYEMETYLPSKYLQVERENSPGWRKKQSTLDISIVRAFVSMEITCDGIVKNECGAGRGEETVTALAHGEFPNDIEIRDASWYTSVFVDKTIPVRGHTRRYWCGSGDERHLELRTIMPHIRSGYHRDAKNSQQNVAD